MPPQCEQPSIKVGIDFGTTYSGVSWVHTLRPDEITVLLSWPQSGGRHDSDKVPSEIYYHSKFTPYGYVWGFDAQKYPQKIEWFKLLLDPSQERKKPKLAASLKRNKDLIPAGKQPVDVVADYLSGLARHTRETLKRTYGEGVLSSVSIEYTLTVPAVWSDAAKDLTLEAAERAGFGSRAQTRLLAEPEAAAVCTLRSVQPNDLKVGNKFVVADCGGGTVDLISYRIKSLNPNLEVDEYAVGGGLCGSSFINRGFEEWISRKVGIQYKVKMTDQGRLHLLREFDEIKKSFSDAYAEDEYTLPAAGLDDDDRAGVDCGLLTVTHEQVKSIMDPVINEVVELVQEQVTMVEGKGSGGVSAILLVGGFGGSEYLRERLERGVRAKSGAKIPLLRPPNPWSAVVRGAVLRSLESPVITTRLARRYYGVTFCTAFIDGIHPVKDRFLHSIYLQWYCDNRARWYIKKGTSIPEHEDIRFPFVRTFLGKADRKGLTSSLYACDINQAPDHVNHESVYTVCELPYDLTTVPEHLFRRQTNPKGQEYYTLGFDLVMSIKSAHLIFSIQVNGQKYGEVAPVFK